MNVCTRCRRGFQGMTHLCPKRPENVSPASEDPEVPTAGSVEVSITDLSESLAIAWDEGFTYGRRMLGASGAKADNPYRDGSSVGDS